MKNVAVRFLSLLAVGTPVLAGCDPSLNVIQVKAGCPDMPLRGPAQFAPAAPEAVIDDFDDGDLWLTRIAGRTGSWVGFGTPGQATAIGEVSSDCVASGAYSGHLSGIDIVNYQANWNAVFIDPFSSAVGFDATTYSGFSLWVAAGVTALPPLELPLGVMTRDTSGGSGLCGVSCGDYYRKRIPLTTTWTRCVIKFTDLAQSGQQGAPQVPLNKREFVSLMFWPERTFDIWIDDVRFEP